MVGPATCWVRLDLLQFSLSCGRDWFTVLGAGDGEETVGSLCGEKAGHSSKNITFCQ